MFENVRKNDKVRVVLIGTVRDIEGDAFYIRTGGGTIAVRNHLPDEVEILERPSDWTDGDVVEATRNGLLWARVDGFWYNVENGTGLLGSTDATVNSWLETNKVAIVRKQKP